MQPHRPRTRTPATARGQGGFTLLELLVVVAVLGVLSGVVVFAVGALTDQAGQSACAADERVLVTALEAHAVTEGAYGDEDALVAAGYLESTSSSHDVVLSGDGYSIIPTGDCVAGPSEEVAVGGGSGGVGALRATTTTLAPTTTAAPTATQSISSMSVAKVNLSTNKWKATATIRVTDDLNGAVAGARVVLDLQHQGRTGIWSNAPGASGTTDDAGVLVLSSSDVNKYPVAGMRFRVASVDADGLTWQPDTAWQEVARP